MHNNVLPGVVGGVAVWGRATKAERTLVEQLAKDGVADLRGGSAPAALIAEILKGSVDKIPAQRQRIVISNGTIDGDLDLTHARLPSGSDAPLRLLEATKVTFGAVQLCDARLGGLRLLDCDVGVLDGERLHIVGDLVLDKSRIAGGIAIERAHVSGILSGCDLKVSGPMLMAMLCAGQIKLVRAAIGGKVDLESCRVDGDIILDGSTMGDGEAALDISAGRIGGLVSLSAPEGETRRFESHGPVVAIGASLGHGLEVCGARLRRGSKAYAIDLARLDTDGCLFLRDDDNDQRLECDGTIDLSGARIGGYARIVRARLTPTSGYEDPITPSKAHPANGVCIDLAGARIANFLEMDDITDMDCGRPSGKFRLVGTYVGLLDDTPATGWPGPPHLDLTGLTYDLLSFESRPLERLDWLMRQFSIAPAATPWALLARQVRDAAEHVVWWFAVQRLPKGQRDGAVAARTAARETLNQQYSPQPFEQLASVLRKMGYDEEADHVAVLKREMRTLCKAEAPWRRFLSVFMNITSRYGYSPKRATGVLGAYWLAGALALTVAVVFRVIHLEGTGAETDAMVRYVLAPGVPLSFVDTPGCRGGVTPLFVLDMLVPGIDLGQTDACRIDTEGPWGGLRGIVVAAYQLLGTILGAITVTTYAGLLRKE